MKEITIERSAVNIEALDADLRAALGSATSGFSIGGGKVVVYLLDTANKQEEEQARLLVLTHDPARLTPQQQARLLREAKLDQARREWGSAELDLTVYTGQGPVIQQLAQKIIFLEREIAAIRNQP